MISCFGAAPFTSAAGFGVATGPACEIDVGCVTLPVGFGVGPPADRFGCDSGWPVMVAGLGAIRFGGVPLGVLGDPPGTFPIGDDLSTGELAVVGFPLGSGGEPPGFPEVFPGGKAPCLSEGFAPIRFGGRAFFPATALLGEGLGVTFPLGEPVTERFSVGKALGVPEGFASSRLGGTSFFPATAEFGESPGVTFVFGERRLGFNKLGGVFCPATAAGEPGAPGDPVTCPLLPICGLANRVGFGKSFGGGFCSAMLFLSFSAS